MEKKTIIKNVCGIVTAIMLAACSGSSIEGKWIEPVPGMEEQVQGVNLEKGGKASSINMATLLYETWEKKGDELFISGKSVGNHQTISFTDTFSIDKLTDSVLILRKGDITLKYQRQP